jgi:hypothetical protein
LGHGVVLRLGSSGLDMMGAGESNGGLLGVWWIFLASVLSG